MSWWTHAKGIVEVRPFGRTQTEKRYILETVLDHLPKVTGSEGDMNIHIIQKNGYDFSSSCDEFWQDSVNGNGRYGSFETQSTYYLMVYGNFRDRMFETTYKEMQKWLCRLAKRVHVMDVMIEITGYFEEEVVLIRNENDIYGQMFEDPSWYDEKSSNWCEYLMWDRFEGYGLPDKLVKKYYPEIYEENNK